MECFNGVNCKEVDMSKYNSKKTEIDGIEFASKGESKRYEKLKDLEQSGLIQDLTLQPSFELIKPFTHSGKKYRGAKYTADFRYLENGEVVIEEFKGFRTQAYILRVKLFLSLYKNITFKEVKK